MERLFDSHGQHIANVAHGRLYAPGGRNIGRYIDSANIFVDIGGRYLGEVLHGNRLLRNRASGYRSTNFGNAGSTGNIGNAGNPGNVGSIGMPGGYEDMDLTTLD
jgi:hypothetical protein